MTTPGSPHPHELALHTWRSVEDYLRRSTVVLLPVGSTEQHGPNGLLGTDFICAEAIAQQAGRQTGVLVAPTMPYGMALHHLGFSGTVALRPETFAAVVRDSVWSLYRHGFRGFVFVNGHGGNNSSARAAGLSITEECPEARLLWLNWWELPEVRALAQQNFANGEGSHATPSEIALTMAARPGAVSPVASPLDRTRCQPRSTHGARAFRTAYPDGRCGSDPSLATPQLGQLLLDTAVAAVAGKLSELSAELAPAPPPTPVRRATDSDSCAIATLIDSIYAEYPGCVMDPTGIDADLAHIATHYAQRYGAVWVAERDGEVVGCVASALAADGTIELHRMYVAAGERRRGLASYLYRLVVAEARNRGAPRLELWSDTRFTAAHRFYERHGLVRQPERRALHDPSETVEFRYVLELCPG